MGKTKRERKNRKFKFHYNRKRMNKSRLNTGTPAAAVPVVKKAWEPHMSIRENLTSMGLSYDPNATLKMPTPKELLKPLILEKDEQDSEQKTPSAPLKAHVADELEADAKALREKKFQLPSGQVRLLSYFINKYGEDYKAMARDGKNIYQETWKQIRNKIKTFQNIPAQWNAYLAKRRGFKKKSV